MKALLETTLMEMPVGDVHHIGNWNKNSSFGAVDRKLVTNPILIQRMRQKFGKTTYDFQIFFVNTPEARNHTEVGQVDMAWLHQNMPKTAEELERLTEQGVGIKEDSINFIFTNNKGAQRVPMTAWIMAHRMGHAFRRAAGTNGQNHGSGYAYKEAESYLINGTKDYLNYDYGTRIEKGMTDRDRYSQVGGRHNELLYRAIWSAIGTFRSAREGKMRDWFEMLNELIAQYITTGEIKFNPLPQQFSANLGGGWGGKRTFRLKPDAEGDTQTLANTMDYAIGDILSNAVSHIYVM